MKPTRLGCLVEFGPTLAAAEQLEGITVDNGPEVAGRVLDAWAYKHEVQLHFIEPGKPQNAYFESFNGKLLDECLNERWFSNLGHARATVEAWRKDYNDVRPHRALGNLAPVQFIQQIQGQSRWDSQNDWTYYWEQVTAIPHRGFGIA